MAWTPWGEVDIPFIQNPFTNRNQGSVPMVQKNWAGFAVTPQSQQKLGLAKAAPKATPQAAVPVAAMGGGTAAGGGGGGYAGGGGFGGYAAPVKDMREINGLRGEAKARGGEINAIYNALFTAVEALARDRASQVERDYGDQLGTAAKQYAEGIPQIEGSYATVGAGDSTDTTYAKNTAKEGLDNTSKTIRKNKEADLSKIGNFVSEQRGKWSADRDSANRLVSRVDQTEDVGDLRATRNALEDKTGGLRADQATLNTDAGARGQLSQITQDAGRKESVLGALDSILKGSMSQAVKDAAVEAVGQAGGLASGDLDEIKKKNALQFGSTYAEQAAL